MGTCTGTNKPDNLKSLTIQKKSDNQMAGYNYPTIISDEQA